jgi:hypothetical protein
MIGTGWGSRSMTLMAIALCASCTDSGGLGPTVRLNAADGSAATFSWAYYTSIVASGDAVVAAWMDQNGERNRDVVARRSEDGGQTWGEPTVLNTGHYANSISVTPRLTLLPKQGELLAVWQTRRSEIGQKYVLVRRSSDLGGTWGEAIRLNSLPQSFLPAVAANDAGAVLVGYDDERNINRDIFVNRSVDDGKSWLEKDVRVDVLARAESGAPTVALGNDGYGYVVWEERPRRAKGREDTSPHLLFASSADLETWSEPQRIVPSEEVSPIWPALAESNGRLIVVWSAGLSGETTKSWLYLATSADRGKTWSTPVTIYEGEAQPLYQIVTEGPHVFLVWHGGEAAQQGGIYFNASDDAGATWRTAWTAPMRIDRPVDGKPTAAYHPRIALHGDSGVAVTWQESNERVLVSVSRDGGLTWPETPVEVAATEKKEEETLRYPQVALGPDSAYVIWERWTERPSKAKTMADIGKPQPRDVYFRRVTPAS